LVAKLRWPNVYTIIRGKNMVIYSWRGTDHFPSVSFCCGYCGEKIASNTGYFTYEKTNDMPMGRVAICHFCGQPTFIDFLGLSHPGAPFGNRVEHLPNNEISLLYDEARRCISVDAYTASIFCCRKLLLNLAVSKGADKDFSFQKCVQYLAEKGYVPPDGKDWVDHIRQKGNEATHEIQLMTKEDAVDLLVFIEMLLKFMYEFPTKMKNKQNHP
jgi:hypothetical protein